jgi:hypothetical protein
MVHGAGKIYEICDDENDLKGERYYFLMAMPERIERRLAADDESRQTIVVFIFAVTYLTFEQSARQWIACLSNMKY